jgi:hypothetical protein
MILRRSSTSVDDVDLRPPDENTKVGSRFAACMQYCIHAVLMMKAIVRRSYNVSRSLRSSEQHQEVISGGEPEPPISMHYLGRVSLSRGIAWYEYITTCYSYPRGLCALDYLKARLDNQESWRSLSKESQNTRWLVICQALLNFLSRIQLGQFDL